MSETNKGAKMTKLYLSGGIANVPNFKEIFQSHQNALEDVGYEVINPCDIEACRPIGSGPGECLNRGEPGTPGDEHSWNCYLRYDLIAMLECDGVAVIMSTFWNSKGAHLEESVAMQVGIPRKPTSHWIDYGIDKYFAAISEAEHENLKNDSI